MNNPHRHTAIRRLRPFGLKLVAVVAVIALFLTEPLWPIPDSFHRLFDRLGITLLVAGLLGRLWCTLYIAGRKSKEVVAEGPYALCRHPLYFFSSLMTVGAILILQHAVAATAFGLAFVLFHAAAVRREEEHLIGKFGAAYETYRQSTPALFPALHRLPRALDLRSLSPSPRHLGRVMVESGPVLLVIPVAELLESAYSQGILPF